MNSANFCPCHRKRKMEAIGSRYCGKDIWFQAAHLAFVECKTNPMLLVYGIQEVLPSLFGEAAYLQLHLSASLLGFGEQSRVLNRDGQLSSQGLKCWQITFGQCAGLVALHIKYANHFISYNERNSHF